MHTILSFSSVKRYSRLLLAILSILALSGCSRQTRHQALTFFFTGVPPLEEKQADHTTALDPPPRSKDESGRSPKSSQKALPPGQQETLPVVPAAPQLFSHTVWAIGNCSVCHEGNGRFGFQPGGTAKSSSAQKLFYSGGGMPGNLRLPKDKICTACHTDKTGLRAIKDDLWLHNTTAKGDCLACHDAHQSKQRGVLRRPAEQLCQPCHPANKLAALPMHNGTNKPCLSCHNPHMGKDRHLLIQDYREVNQAAKREL
ncbi:MAG: cytochrome c3 family protein [Desulfuromonadaceae bacterium]|nr:cytochrome c3 family protein [Desulfuromonadaceae bacterium]MDD2847685.1 cytochrome c3 family protein [Desulfuromonadaceae bacterium]MDD4131069.1 cytochrome c3 family protein [Desulfuromonadaceae bacterium]